MHSSWVSGGGYGGNCLSASWLFTLLTFACLNHTRIGLKVGKFWKKVEHILPALLRALNLYNCYKASVAMWCSIQVTCEIRQSIYPVTTFLVYTASHCIGTLQSGLTGHISGVLISRKYVEWRYRAKFSSINLVHRILQNMYIMIVFLTHTHTK